MEGFDISITMYLLLSFVLFTIFCLKLKPLWTSEYEQGNASGKIQNLKSASSILLLSALGLSMAAEFNLVIKFELYGFYFPLLILFLMVHPFLIPLWWYRKGFPQLCAWKGIPLEKKERPF